MMAELDLEGELPSGRVVIEASAGTGKTYSLSALVVRHVAERERAASELLLVTFTRAAAAELRDRTRAALVAAEGVLATRRVPDRYAWMHVLLRADEDELVERHRRVAEAVRSFDDATITTIHGFCQLALRQLGLRSGAAVDTELTNHQAWYVEEVCRDLVLQELHLDPTALDWPADNPPNPGSVLEALKKSVQAVLGNRGIRIVPDHTCTPDPDDRPGRLDRWVELVHTAVAEVGARQRAKQEMGYDELINGLHDAVTDPHTGPSAVATLRSRYRLVLVDEFQDTDSVQWATFERIFAGDDLVTVGDPKQAIYRFRGADVHAYLEAVEGVEHTRRLGTNRRSDPSLVLATNRLLAGVRLGDPRIAVTEVDTPEHATDALAGPPLRIRRVLPGPSVCNKNGTLQAGLTDRAIVDDVVRVTVDLLDHEPLTVDGVSRPLSPGDVAVLVRSNEQAKKVVEALVAGGIPAVRARTGSVLTSEAVEDLTLLLAALEQPSHGGLVRNVGLGVFVGIPAAELDPSPADPADVERNEERFAALQRQCARWADQLTRGPFLAWYDTVRAESGVAARVLRHPMGERRLTDLDHLAELLGAELGGTRTTAASARRVLERLVLSADDQDTGPQMRRIDSDARAVQVSTVHGSKGLEYPVVLLPFGWKDTQTRPPYEYHTSDGRRTIDIASGHGWSGATAEEAPEARQHLAKVGDLGDDLRLLYVALTRAKHRSVVWWAPYSRGAAWGLSKVLFDRDPSGAPAHTEPTLRVEDGTAVTTFPGHVPAADAIDGAFERLQARGRADDGRPLIAVEDVPLDAPPARWVEPLPDLAPPALGPADPRGRHELADPAWRRWSFTGITRDRHDVWVPAMPVTGGTDEPDDVDDGRSAAAPEMPWAAVAGGTAFGTLVHEVLEHVDPTSSTLDDNLTRLVAARSAGAAATPSVAEVVAGLAAAMRTPMGPIVDGACLVDIAPTDRLAEVDFDLPLSTGRVVAAPRIGEVLLATLPPDDPQLAYARQLADGRFPTDLKGYLTGSIDAVLRVRAPDGGQRFVVVDYKTNRLHRRDATRPLEAYHPDALPDAMADADYPLQSLLYSVALHRYLRWRLRGDYRPEVHLGGIAYLFLRGMVGPATPTTEDGRVHGVFSWQPPAETVLALDRLLAVGGAA